MAEHPTAQPDTDEVRWNTGPLDQPKTEPSGSKKDVGYVIDEIPPSVQWNWLLNKIYNLFIHLVGRSPREFDYLAEGIAAVSTPDTFRVRAPAAGLSNPFFDKVFTEVTGAGTGNILMMCTDGERLFYSQVGPTAGKVYGAGTHDGVLDWTYSGPGVAVTALACDGSYVYKGSVVSGAPEVEVLNAATGALISSGNIETGVTISALASNGTHLAIAYGQLVRIYTLAAGVPTAVAAAYDHGATISAIAIDSTRAYIGGVRGTGSKDLRAITLSTGALLWDVAFPTTTAPVINGIAADSRQVFVGTDVLTLSAGGLASVFAYSAADSGVPPLLWTTNPGDSVQRIYIDDRNVYVLRGAGLSYAILRSDHEALRRILAGVLDEVWGTDSVGVLVTDGATDYTRLYIGGPTKTFQRVDSDDPNRRPFYTLAIPLE